MGPPHCRDSSCVDSTATVVPHPRLAFGVRVGFDGCHPHWGFCFEILIRPPSCLCAMSVFQSQVCPPVSACLSHVRFLSMVCFVASHCQLSSPGLSACIRSAVPRMGAAGIWTGDRCPSVGWAPGPGGWVFLDLLPDLLPSSLRVSACEVVGAVGGSLLLLF